MPHPTFRPFLFALLLMPLLAPGADPETELTLGATLTQGNSETLVSHAGVEHTSDHEGQALSLKLDARYGESTSEEEGTQTTVQNARMGLTYRHDLTPPYYTLFTAQAYHDDLAKLNYRTVLGPGLGIRVLDGEAHQLIVEAGAVWLSEAYRGDAAPPKGHGSYIAARLGQEYRLTLNEHASVWQTLEILPTVDAPRRVLANLELGAKAKMSGRLSLRVVLQDRYNSEPAEGVKENDLSLIGGIGYTL